MDTDNVEINDNNNLLSNNEDTLYLYLLNNIYETLEKNCTSFNKTIQIKKQNIKFNVNRKTIWTDFKKTCIQYEVDEQQFIHYISKELTTTMSINQDGDLLIKGRYSDTLVENIFAKYLKLYKQCSVCGTFNTKNVKKDNGLLYLICYNKHCKSEKVIKNII